MPAEISMLVATGQRTQDMRVMFVDDESNVLDALRRQSRKSAFEAYFAASGEDALTVLARTAMDVVVSDMRMPGIDGAELLERVSVLHPRTLRIALSGDAAADLRARASRTAHAWLSKPCSFADICATIAELRARPA
jgi:CheY-like chemotaxis protein